ncbi:MAG: hypothetical protein K8T90_00915 [Planctomycetes bacterium]|nr:hypothetical protein [Planctomycetota bacterium]
MKRKSLAVLTLALVACAAPVSVRPADPRDVYRTINAYALNEEAMSSDAAVTLARADLVETFDREPVAALRKLHELSLEGDRRERLYALAELSYLAAERTGDRSLFVASAVYAHLFLFGGGPEPLPGPFRRRFRRACDVNGVALARAFSDSDGEFVPQAGRVELPVGSIEIDVPRLPMHVQGFAYDDLRPAAELELTGFRTRAVRSGVGAPLVARRKDGTMRAERRAHLASGSALAVTAFLQVEGEVEDAGKDGLKGRVEFFRPNGARDVQVRGTTVPIEFDVTAPLAIELDEKKPWEKEVSAFLDTDGTDVESAVTMTEPYEPGRIPVVLVHGTASSPARWAELLNEMHDDGYLAANCQFWIYEYGSGQPILVSAAGLRRGIERVVKDVDPEGKDAALRQMVVIGHSQGGLLTRLMGTASGDHFWKTVSDKPFDDVDLTDSARRYIRPVFFFEPSPYVQRLIFVATPHRGSHVAGNWIGKLGASLVSVPSAVARGAGRLARAAVGAGGINLQNFSTAVADMNPESSFIATLGDTLPSITIPMHSVVAIDGGGGIAEGDDGVVLAKSAHLEEARSEVIVHNDHSCQGHPGTVAEIRRVLHVHLKACGR